MNISEIENRKMRGKISKIKADYCRRLIKLVNT